MINNLALARKYRPQKFNEIVGQKHVLNGLINSLDSQKLHHAYILTGTRGVGKTSLARIFAKSLECEKGISSNPCGVCSTCKAITKGGFVDVIEIDAASRTKVEDTRDILDNVQYMPTQGRFKIYIIDEVHMLSNASFNALLKTLEEPPEHVKFILATTDPHKLPVTVLSRCLQFHLNHLTNNDIAKELENICVLENYEYDKQALVYIAEFAKGSMRDALSLAEQALAYNNYSLKTDNIIELIGIIDIDVIINVAISVINKDMLNILKITKKLEKNSIDYIDVLNKLSSLWFHVNLFQMLGNSYDSEVDEETLKNISNKISPQETQLLYQISINNKKDIMNAPSKKIGLDMALLRMIAFLPDDLSKLENKRIKNDNIINITKNEKKNILNNENIKVEKVEIYTHVDTKIWQEIVNNVPLVGAAKLLLLNSCASENNDNFKVFIDSQHKAMMSKSALIKINSVLSNMIKKKIYIESNEINLKNTVKVQNNIDDDNKKNIILTKFKNNEIFNDFCNKVNVDLKVDNVIL